MTAALWLGRLALADALQGAPALRIPALACLVAGGMVVYALLAVVTRAADPSELKRLLRRNRPARQTPPGGA